MGKKKEKENLAKELADSFERWEYLKEHGGSDPFYADGGSMNLVRNHIIYYKQKMVEEYGRDYEKYPEIFYRELPPEVDGNYMARAGEIRDGAAEALEYYLSDPNFHYLLANKDMLTEKEAKQISLYNVLGYASGLASAIKDGGSDFNAPSCGQTGGVSGVLCPVCDTDDETDGRKEKRAGTGAGE